VQKFVVLHSHVKHNPVLNTLEFGGVKNQASENTFSIYPKDLIGMVLQKEQALIRRKEERGW
jgi:hypothetical protein